MKTVFIKEGDTLVVGVVLPPSVADPGGEFPVSVGAFRVVAFGGDDPILSLVPLQSSPKLMTRSDLQGRRYFLTEDELHGNV